MRGFESRFVRLPTRFTDTQQRSAVVEWLQFHRDHDRIAGSFRFQPLSRIDLEDNFLVVDDLFDGNGEITRSRVDDRQETGPLPFQLSRHCTDPTDPLAVDQGACGIGS